MTDLVPFDFTGQEVRVVTDEQGEPWFVVADIARVLGYRDAANAARLVEDDERGYSDVSTPGGTQTAITVNESGVYALVFRSNHAQAVDFRRFVTGTILPTIRKTGSYVAPQSDHDRALVLAHEVIALHARLDEQAPKVAAHDALIAAEGDYSLREAAQTLSRDHGIDTGQNRLLRHLRNLGWVDSRGLPYQRAIQTGRLAVRTSTYEHPHTGEPQLSTQLRVTGKGLTWLHTNWPRPTAGLKAIEGGAA